MANALVAWAKTLPADARTSQEYAETVQFAGDLAGMLPSAEAMTLRKELKELRVSVFVVRTVREQMRYDTPRLVVEAGKPFEIILENGDMMPHNLAVVKPGTRPKLAAIVGNHAAATTGFAKAAPSCPSSPDILAGTKLVDPASMKP